MKNNKAVYIIILLLLQSLPVFIPVDMVRADSPYGGNIVGDTVYWENSYANLSVYPHTSTNLIRQKQWANLTWKETDNIIDVAFRFNDSLTYGKIWRWNGDSWVGVSMQHTTYNGKHYYYYEGFNVVQDTTYRFKWEYDTVANTSGKWDLFAKLNQHTIQQALDNDWYVALDPWWDSNWICYRTITIDHTYINAPLTNFPLMVYIPSTITPSCDGGDSIRFISSNNVTAFAYEIEYWDATGSYVWVNISETIPSGSNYTFLMYYNNAGASDNQNPTGVWDSNYQFVHHMNESVGSNYIYDSTGYDNDGAKVGSPSFNNTGKVGKAINFNGNDDCFADVLPKGDLNHDTSFFEFWVKPDNADATGIAVGWVCTGDNRFFLGQSDTDTGEWRYGWGDQYEYYGTPDTNWHYLSYRVTTGEVISAYVDGIFYASENSAGFSDGTSDIYIGVGIDNTSAYRFDGLIDEVRISNSSRNTSWMNASFHSMNQTTGFLTWGGEISEMEAPTGFVATTLSDSEMFLNWTKAVNTTHTYLVRKTGGYPASRTDGTNIYNSTGVNYTDDTGLSIMTVYYYSAWGFNSTTGNWTISAGATNHTGAENPTNVGGVVSASYFNVTWTKGIRADNTTVVRKASGFPTAPTDGTEIYNSSGTFYNDTSFSGGYYKLFSWNTTVDLFSSGVNAPYGSLTIRVYDEGNGTAITGWDVFITNQNGTQTYENLNNNNPLVIDIDDLPLGNNIAIKINATDYNFSLFYMNLVTNTQYTLNAHLTPMDLSELYLLTVLNEMDIPVEDATMGIQRYINATVGFEYVGIYITDANGQVSTYLVPYELYKFTISKTGYVTEIADWTPDIEIRTKTFRLNIEASEPVEFNIFWDNISFTGTMDSGGNITISFSDNSLLTTNTQVYLYEQYNGTDTLLDSKSYGSVNSYSYSVLGCNNSRMHYASLYINHSYDFSIDQPVIIYIQPTNRTFSPHSIADLESAFTSVLGRNPLGWGNSIAFFVAIVMLCSFAPFDIGAGIISAVLSLVGIELAFVLNPTLIIIVPIGVAIGIFYMFANRQAEEYT